jgi:hypothetical protein
MGLLAPGAAAFFGAGLGGAAAGLVGALGITGTLGSVLTGAITYGAYGAAAGGLISAIAGKDVLKGMQAGAVTGAITGGIGAGTGLIATPAASWGPQSAMSIAENPAWAMQPSMTGPPGIPPVAAPGPGAVQVGLLPAGVSPPMTAPAATPALPVAAAPPASANSPWLEIAGKTAQGIGGALFAPEPGEGAINEGKWIQGNYATHGGGLAPPNAYPSGAQTVSFGAGFQPAQPQSSSFYAYDPQTRKMTKTPTPQPMNAFNPNVYIS